MSLPARMVIRPSKSKYQLMCWCPDPNTLLTGWGLFRWSDGHYSTNRVHILAGGDHRIDQQTDHKHWIAARQDFLRKAVAQPVKDN